MGPIPSYLLIFHSCFKRSSTLKLVDSRQNFLLAGKFVNYEVPKYIDMMVYYYMESFHSDWSWLKCQKIKY